MYNIHIYNTEVSEIMFTKIIIMTFWWWSRLFSTLFRLLFLLFRLLCTVWTAYRSTYLHTNTKVFLICQYLVYRYRRHLTISQKKWLKKKTKNKHLRKKSYQFSTLSLREQKREHSLTHSMRSALPYYQNQTKHYKIGK